MKTPDVLYCDNHVLVAVKPPNVPAQADISGDEDMLTMMRAYVKERYQKPGAVFLGLVHRLDRPVGGLMAFARTSKAASRLSGQLRTHAMRREYLAIARGDAPDEARLEDLLPRGRPFAAGRAPGNRPQAPNPHSALPRRPAALGRRPLRPRPAGRADCPVGRAPDLHASDPGPGHVLCCPAAHVVSLEQIQYY